MLRLERVSKYYFTGNNVVQALRRVNLEFKIGEFVAITGVSGSGKSTLLNVLSGLDTYEEGKVFFDEKDISNYSLEELEHYRKDYIGYIFQDFNIINSYTVYQNIELALLIQGYSKEQRKARVLELIEQVGLTHVTHQKASKLSGGEKQRTIIARTLAKDYQILICDEPTGNLNIEAAQGIFSLLQKISKDKLVIVVTHDITLLQDYATRKVRLYDGEVMEDVQLKPFILSSSNELQSKLSETKLLSAFKIGLRNILTVPKKSIFSFFTLLFILAVVFFAYSAGLYEVSQPLEVVNEEFTNATPSRIILIKDDFSPFSDSELSVIKELNHVRGVFGRDIVFDSVLVSKQSITLVADGYLYFKPLAALALEEEDLVSGDLPVLENEVVVGNNGLFQIGDTIEVANNHLLILNSTIDTDQFVFTVVGLMDEPKEMTNDLHSFYLSIEGLSLISNSSLYEVSDVEIRIEGTKKYVMATDTWITPEMDNTVQISFRNYELSYPLWIKVNDNLEDNQMLVFDMMFFDICREFDYKKEIVDDMDAGLCNVPDFVDSHEIALRVSTNIINDRTFEEIEIVTFIDVFSSFYNPLSSIYIPEGAYDPILYMNEDTFSRYFSEDNYQVSVIVKDYYDALKVIEDLEELGYNYFYPAEMFTDYQVREMAVNSLIVSLLVGVIIFVVAFVGYFILRNLIFSKLKDYLIIRSIGTSKKAIKQIIRSEILILTMIASIIVLILVVIFESYIISIPDLIRYYKWYDYLILLFVVSLIVQIMSARFSKLIFKASVVSALKGVER